MAITVSWSIYQSIGVSATVVFNEKLNIRLGDKFSN